MVSVSLTCCFSPLWAQWCGRLGQQIDVSEDVTSRQHPFLSSSRIATWTHTDKSPWTSFGFGTSTARFSSCYAQIWDIIYLHPILQSHCVMYSLFAQGRVWHNRNISYPRKEPDEWWILEKDRQAKKWVGFGLDWAFFFFFSLLNKPLNYILINSCIVFDSESADTSKTFLL